MNNPFFKNGYLMENASINKLYINKVTLEGVDENIIGKAAEEIFSSRILFDEIKDNSDKLKIDLSKIEEKMLPKILNKALLSNDYEIRKASTDIVRKFSERLGIILLTLKQGEYENKKSRKDWSDKC